MFSSYLNILLISKPFSTLIIWFKNVLYFLSVKDMSLSIQDKGEEIREKGYEGDE